MIKKRGITTLSGIAVSSIVIASVMSVAIQLQQNALAQSSSNPLAKVPVIGQLMGGGKGGNATSSSSGNATSNSSSSGNATSSSSSGNQSSSNPLAKVPVIGQLLGNK
jgi:hypothetical protein